MHEKAKTDPSGNVWEVEGGREGGGERERERERNRHNMFHIIFLGGRGDVSKDL